MYTCNKVDITIDIYQVVALIIGCKLGIIVNIVIRDVVGTKEALCVRNTVGK